MLTLLLSPAEAGNWDKVLPDTDNLLQDARDYIKMIIDGRNLVKVEDKNLKLKLEMSIFRLRVLKYEVYWMYKNQQIQKD